MATDVDGETPLTAINDEPRTVGQWTTTFHLFIVAVDPFTYESSWILDTAVRLLRTFAEADCRCAFLVTGTADEARQFLGPITEEFLTFADPDRKAVAAFGLERLPGLVHLNQDGQAEGVADGWDPDQWRAVSEHLAHVMSWRRPIIPQPADPVPFEGTPAAG